MKNLEKYRPKFLNIHHCIKRLINSKMVESECTYANKRLPPRIDVCDSCFDSLFTDIMT